MCLEIYELDSAYFLSALGLAWQQPALKKARVKVGIWINMDMLLMVEKGARVAICYAIHPYAKANNKFIKHYDEIKETSYLMYYYLNNLCGWSKIICRGF